MVLKQQMGTREELTLAEVEEDLVIKSLEEKVALELLL